MCLFFMILLNIHTPVFSNQEEKSTSIKDDIDISIKQYERKRITFIQKLKYTKDNDLVVLESISSEIIKGLMKNFPRFDYHLEATTAENNLEKMYTDIYEYFLYISGDVAQKQEKYNEKFKEKIVSWSATQSILKSSYIIEFEISRDPVEIRGPLVSRKYYINTNILKLHNNKFIKYKTLKHNINITYPPASFDKFSRDYVEQRINDVQKLDPIYIINDINFYKIQQELKKIDDFSIAGTVSSINEDGNVVEIDFDKESGYSLGMHVGDYFFIYENRIDDKNNSRLAEIGFGRIRQLLPDVKAQLISKSRPIEKFDQIGEIPLLFTSSSKNSDQFQLKFIPMSLGLNDKYKKIDFNFTPSIIFGGKSDFLNDKDTLTDFSDLKFTTEGGFTFGTPESHPDFKDVSINLFKFSYELGLEKHWYIFDQAFVFLGGKVGFLLASVSNPDKLSDYIPSGDDVIFSTWPTQFVPYIAPVVGIGIDLSPYWSFGLGAGYRWSPLVNNNWGYIVYRNKDEKYNSNIDGWQSVEFPGLSTNGFTFNVYGQYRF